MTYLYWLCDTNANKTKGSLLKDGKVIRSAGVVGSFTLLSRGLGMVRDVIIGYYFGTSLVASAFFVAFTIPNLFRRLFGEGALSDALIPVFI
jgi:putative peptidoglycan lipid II flippase